MDLNETSGVVENRHPWELSRTGCFIEAIRPYLDKLHMEAKASMETKVSMDNDGLTYINIGAGDLYFDYALLEIYKKDTVHAVDIAYPEIGGEGNVNKYHYLEQVPGIADYAVMMDSLEYIEDDVAFLNEMAGKVKEGGWVFFTLPNYPSLYSGYDILIKNLRRYNRKTFHEVVSQVPGLEIKKMYNFYTLLFILRVIEKIKKQEYDSEEYLTAMWKHEEKGFVTQFLKLILNIDFSVNKLLSKIGIRLPGLSLLAICRVEK